MEIRPYDPATDRSGLYDCKLAFEHGLGAGTGDADKAEAYVGKLTPSYREEWLTWVDRCVADDERCVTVAIEEGPGGNGDGDGDSPLADPVVGYVFCLPERLAFVWDAAVINELYVAPHHRGTGVADDLMDAALELAADQDLPLDRVVLDVDRGNERARAFYDRHGFEHWGEMVARHVEQSDLSHS
ncbi:GNAT family N-acetyltransferase [Halorubrum sp. DTA98]|uniref:GNAT family N-acetyltransferase n=1 Tax=Halorubrum sp. DTA98 TaxID=3402163 RepID=UPI003AAE604B